MLKALDLSLVDWDDKTFVKGRLRPFPDQVQRQLFNRYLSIASKRERNTFLRETTDALAEKISIPLHKLNLNVSEDGLRADAKRNAEACLALRRFHLFHSLDEILTQLEQFTTLQGVKPPSRESYSVVGITGRLCDDKWWLRKLRKAHIRNVEVVYHHLNQVNRIKGIYCSNPTLKARLNQKHFQQEYLANTIATNQAGESFSLLELSQKGVADPKIRKAELMVRARGFEEMAKELGHEATFITITCPSKYHRSYSKSGMENPNWEGYTPWDGQQYLTQLWTLIRSKLHREGVRFYGFRVAEPQHDGTPHWHMLFFVEPEHYPRMIEVMRNYAMREDSQEKGADQHRFTEVKIDENKGSATGYIAKYIAKNIDGEDLESGVYGEDPKSAAARVDAWAACWGIRQFQQLGGCSVTVWRELRRLKSLLGEGELAEKITNAADNSDWKTFTQLMGGVFCKRKEQAFQPHYELSFDTDTGVVKTSQYCESELVRALKGVAIAGRAIITRLHEWRIAFQVPCAP